METVQGFVYSFLISGHCFFEQFLKIFTIFFGLEVIAKIRNCNFVNPSVFPQWWQQNQYGGSEVVYEPRWFITLSFVCIFECVFTRAGGATLASSFALPGQCVSQCDGGYLCLHTDSPRSWATRKSCSSQHRYHTHTHTSERWLSVTLCICRSPSTLQVSSTYFDLPTA